MRYYTTDGWEKHLFSRLAKTLDFARQRNTPDYREKPLTKHVAKCDIKATVFVNNIKPPYREKVDKMMRIKNTVAMMMALAMIFGCAATHTSIAKKELDVQTKMSESIFLEPVAPAKRVVFIQLRNTSDKQNFNIEQELKAAIRAKGYRVIDDPEKAHYKLLAQILNVSKTDPTAAEAALDEGYGGAGGILAGGTAGAVVGGALGDSKGALIGAGIGALIGGIAETVSSASTKDVMFVAITDIQVSEKTRDGVTGLRKTKVAAGQGVGGKERQTFTEKVNEKRYRTRVVSAANKVNLKYEEAAPALTSGLVRALSGLF